MEHLFLTFSFIFIISVIFSQFDWGIAIDNELNYLLAVSLYSVCDLSLFLLIRYFFRLAERKRQAISLMTRTLTSEGIRLIINVFLFVFVIAISFDIDVRNYFSVAAIIAITAVLRITVVLLMRRENR